MSDKVKPIPDGYTGAVPYICVNDGQGALEFYKTAFGAIETQRFAAPGGKIGHAEFKIGPAAIMLADEFPEEGFRSPLTLGGTPIAIHIYVENVDSVAAQAVAAGAKLIKEVSDKFYGDRNCSLEDPYGHRWYVSTHKEDVSSEEMQKRAAAMQSQSGNSE